MTLADFANLATIAAAVAAIWAIFNGYQQFTETERLRRVDNLETRIMDAFLALPPTMVVPTNFLSGRDYQDQLSEFDQRRLLARLLRYWRAHSPETKPQTPIVEDCWRKLTVDFGDFSPDAFYQVGGVWSCSEGLRGAVDGGNKGRAS